MVFFVEKFVSLNTKLPKTSTIRTETEPTPVALTVMDSDAGFGATLTLKEGFSSTLNVFVT